MRSQKSEHFLPSLRPSHYVMQETPFGALYNPKWRPNFYQPKLEFKEYLIPNVLLTVVGGYALGGVFGLFLSALDTSTNHDSSTKIQMRQQLMNTKKKIRGLSRNFGYIGGLFSLSQCCIERTRAKNDIYNTLGAGCFSGAILGAQGGVISATLGCLGFGLLSLAFDYVMLSR